MSDPQRDLLNGLTYINPLFIVSGLCSTIFTAWFTHLFLHRPKNPNKWLLVLIRTLSIERCRQIKSLPKGLIYCEKVLESRGFLVSWLVTMAFVWMSLILALLTRLDIKLLNISPAIVSYYFVLGCTCCLFVLSLILVCTSYKANQLLDTLDLYMVKKDVSLLAQEKSEIGDLIEKLVRNGLLRLDTS